MAIPVVPISEFKANPARFMTSGAIVTNHGKPRARLVPIDAGEVTTSRRSLEASKASLTVLYRLQSAQDVASELAELAASRAVEIIGEPQ